MFCVFDMSHCLQCICNRCILRVCVCDRARSRSAIWSYPHPWCSHTNDADRFWFIGQMVQRWQIATKAAAAACINPLTFPWFCCWCRCCCLVCLFSMTPHFCIPCVCAFCVLFCCPDKPADVQCKQCCCILTAYIHTHTQTWSAG